MLGFESVTEDVVVASRAAAPPLSLTLLSLDRIAPRELVRTRAPAALARLPFSTTGPQSGFGFSGRLDIAHRWLRLPRLLATRASSATTAETVRRAMGC